MWVLISDTYNMDKNMGLWEDLTDVNVFFFSFPFSCDLREEGNFYYTTGLIVFVHVQSITIMYLKMDAHKNQFI